MKGNLVNNNRGNGRKIMDVGFDSFIKLLGTCEDISEIISYRYNLENDLIKNIENCFPYKESNMDSMIGIVDLCFTKLILERYGIKNITINSNYDSELRKIMGIYDREVEIVLMLLDEENIAVIIICKSKGDLMIDKEKSLIEIFLIYIEEKLNNCILKEKLSIANNTIEGTKKSIKYGFLLLDSYGRIRECNSIAENMIELGLGRIKGSQVSDILNIVYEDPHLDYCDCIDNIFLSAESSGWGSIGALVTEEGKVKYVDTCYNPCFDEAGNVTSVSMFLSDVTEDIHNEGRLSYISKYDIMTGIYNRERFIEVISEEENRSQYYSIIVCDIDGLRGINIEKGYSYGDFLIKKFAKSIRKSVGANDIFARWGEDEFIVLIKEANIDHIRFLCRSIEDKVNDSLISNERLKISFGISIKEVVNESPLDLLHKAEKNLIYMKNRH